MNWFFKNPLYFKILCLFEIKESKQNFCAIRCGKQIIEYNPDILVITGHDAYYRKKRDKSNYKNTDKFIDAVKIARKYGYGIRMVTLEGEYLSPGGSMAGGAFRNSSNLLARNREIEELEKNIKDILKTIEEMESVLCCRRDLNMQVRNLHHFFF